MAIFSCLWAPELDRYEIGMNQAWNRYESDRYIEKLILKREGKKEDLGIRHQSSYTSEKVQE